MTQQTFKWAKRLILVLAIIPILLFLAFAGAVSLIDFNQYKPQIEQEVGKLTQRELKIEGAVDVSVLPFMFHVGKLSLKNPEGFPEENFLTLEEAHIELSLQALFLDKKIDILSLELIKPRIHFYQMEGKNNWDNIPLFAGLTAGHPLFEQPKASLVAENEFNPEFLLKAAQNPASQVPNATDKESAVEDSWFLESLVVQEAEIFYKNYPQDFQVELNKLNLITFDVEPGKPFKVNSDFTYQHSHSPRKFEFEINTHLRLEDNYTKAHLTDWSGVFRLQLPDERNVPDIRLNTSGKNLLLDFKHQQIYVHKALLSGLESEVETSFQGEFGADPIYQGEFFAKQIDVKSWLEHLGLPIPKMKDEAALKNASGRFSFVWDGNTLKLENIDATVDQSQISGRVDIPLLNPLDDTFEFDLKVSNFDAENYLIDSEQADKQYYLPVLLPEKNLNKLNAKGKLVFENLHMDGLNANQLSMNLQAKEGVYEIAPFDIEFADGSLYSSLELMLAQEPMQMAWHGKVVDLNLSELKSTIPLEGKLNSRFALTSTGSEPDDWLVNLNGSFQANINAPKLKKVDINQILAGKLSLTNQNASTQLESIQAVGMVEKGVFYPKRLNLKGKGFSGAGNGQFDLAKNQMNGELRLLISDAETNLAALRNKVVPLNFTGSMQSPQWALAVK